MPPAGAWLTCEMPQGQVDCVGLGVNAEAVHDGLDLADGAEAGNPNRAQVHDARYRVVDLTWEPVARTL
jgi:hypothetical protein